MSKRRSKSRKAGRKKGKASSGGAGKRFAKIKKTLKTWGRGVTAKFKNVLKKAKSGKKKKRRGK